jgi:hypothetical protein
MIYCVHRTHAVRSKDGHDFKQDAFQRKLSERKLSVQGIVSRPDRLEGCSGRKLDHGRALWLPSPGRRVRNQRLGPVAHRQGPACRHTEPSFCPQGRFTSWLAWAHCAVGQDSGRVRSTAARTLSGNRSRWRHPVRPRRLRGAQAGPYPATAARGGTGAKRASR